MKTFLLMTVLLVLLNTSLTSELIKYPENEAKGLITCDSDDLYSIGVEFSLQEFRIDEITLGSNTYHRISAGKDSQISTDNPQQLSSFSNLITIPDQGNVNFEVTLSETEIYQGIDLGASIIANPDIISISDPMILRDLRVVNLTLNPFQYDPVSKNLTVYKNLKLEVNTEGNGGINPKTSIRKRSQTFAAIYESLIINYSEFDLRDYYQQPSYVLIYPDNENVALELEDLVGWKKRKGFEVTALSTAVTGSSLNEIRSYLQNAYNNWDNPPEFVCLVGDAHGNYTIPCSFYEGGEGDQLYSLLEGDDILADVIVGRISYNDIFQLQNIISKTLSYEQNPYLEEPDWFTNTLLSADPSYSSPATVNNCLYIKEMILDLNPEYTFDEVYSPPFAPPMNTSLNNGACYYVYRGQAGMNNWNPNNHNSGYKFYTGVLVTCHTGDYYDCTGITEEILRLGTPSQPNGGVTAIGTTGPFTHTSFNNIVTGGIFDALFNQDINSIGAALVYGKLLMTLNYPNNPANHVYQFCYWNNLMGDPTVEPWTNQPVEIMVLHEPEIGIGKNYLETSVSDTSGNPVENALVSIYQDNLTQSIAGFTDPDGTVILPVLNLTPDSADLTVTGPNLIPYLGAVEFSVLPIDLNCSDYQVDDDDLGNSSGNSDGYINPGEIIELNTGITNYGSEPAQNVCVILESASELVSIQNDYQEFGTIPPVETVYGSDNFIFTVFENAPGNSQVRFDLYIQSTENPPGTDYLYLDIYGPDLVYQFHQIIDGNNQELDPGESGELIITILNQGQTSCPGIYGLLETNTNLIMVENELSYFGDLGDGNETSNSSDPFLITANCQILPGSIYDLTMSLYNMEGYEGSISFPLAIRTGEINDPLGPDAYGYWCYDDGDTDYYNVPIYEWIEIDPDYGGMGIVLDLVDYGNQGDIITLDLPFVFQFYGEVYNEITICTNGWICLGVTEQESFMNWHVPGPLGPSPMIAPFWDDLITQDGSVCYFYDTELHYFIVEWSHLHSEYDYSSEETFEVILYDPAYYPTSTGDGDIKIQYQEINNIDVGSYGVSHIDHGQYATVGIEDHTGQIGLEYTFNNEYPAAARPLEDEMALLFSGPFIAPEEPVLVMGGLSILDDDGNGNADYAENINLQVLINNMGDNPATGIDAMLATTDPYLTVNQSVSSYPDIPGGGQGSNETLFNLDIAANCPDGHIAQCDLILESNESVWELTIYLNLNAPDLQVGHLLILNDDNCNGILDPGENTDIYLPLINEGGSSAYNISALLSSDNPEVIINDNFYTLDTLYFDQTDELIYNITLDESAFIGQQIQFQLDISAEHDIQLIHYFTIIVGQGFALDFDGIDDKVLIQDAPSLNPPNAITLEAWVYPTENHSGDIISKDGEWYDRQYLLNKGSNQAFRAHVGVPSGLLWFDGNTTVIINQWYYVAMTYNGSQLILYVNGEEDGSLGVNGNIITTTVDVRIGGGAPSEPNHNCFGGIIDEARIWNIARTQEEIIYDMYSNLTGNEEGLVAYWRIDEGSGDVIYDYTINSNDGSINGATWTEGVILNGLAPPRNLRAILNDSTVYLNWEPPIDDNGLTGYNIYRNEELLNNETITDTFYTDQNLSFGSYIYFARAIYAQDNESVNSNEINIVISEYGHELYFNGDNNYVTIPNDSSLNITENITLESWIKFEVGGSMQPRIISKGPDGSGYELLTSNTDEFRQIIFRSAPGNLQSQSMLQADIWYHVAVTYDGTQIKMYLNGELNSSLNGSGNLEVNTIPLYLGQKSTSAWDKYKGLMDEVRIWNCARSAEEIRSSMNLILTGNEDGLQAYWRMDEGISNFISDQTLNDNDGLMNGESVWNQSLRIAVPDFVNHSPVLEIPIMNYFWSGEEGEINLEFSYDPEVLMYNELILENTQLQNWVVNVENEDGSIFVNAWSTELLQSETDTLLVFSFDPLVTDTETIFLFDSAHFGEEFIRTRSSRIQLGEVGSSDLIIPVYTFALEQNYPNPFNPATSISYQLEEESRVTLSVYNIKGQLIKKLVNEIKPVGKYSVIWDGTDQSNQSVPSGIYLYRLKTKDDAKIKKMILLR